MDSQNVVQHENVTFHFPEDLYQEIFVPGGDLKARVSHRWEHVNKHVFVHCGVCYIFFCIHPYKKNTYKYIFPSGGAGGNWPENYWLFVPFRAGLSTHSLIYSLTNQIIGSTKFCFAHPGTEWTKSWSDDCLAPLRLSPLELQSWRICLWR